MNETIALTKPETAEQESLLPVRAELPAAEKTAEPEPEYIDAEFREITDIESQLVERGSISEEEIADRETLPLLQKSAHLDQLVQVAEAELAQLEELSKTLDISEDSRATYEETLQKQESRAAKFRQDLLAISGIQGEKQLLTPVILEELESRLDALDLTLKREREKAVLNFIVDSTDWALRTFEHDLDRCKNNKQARQLIIFTIYQGVMKQAQRFIREGGSPDYGFRLQYELVEHPGTDNAKELYFSNIYLNFDYAGTYSLSQKNGLNDSEEYADADEALALLAA